MLLYAQSTGLSSTFFKLFYQAEIAGIGEVTPIFSRSKITNETERVNMVIAEAPYIGTEAVIELLPNLDPEQKEQIKKNLLAERAMMETDEPEDEEE